MAIFNKTLSQGSRIRVVTHTSCSGQVTYQVASPDTGGMLHIVSMAELKMLVKKEEEYDQVMKLANRAARVELFELGFKEDPLDS